MELGDKFHCFKVKLNDSSHNECLKIINEMVGKFIIFLGHGRSDALYGACGDQGDNIFISDDLKEEDPIYYDRQDFITIENSNVFNQNIIFSLSCNSNIIKKSIGESSIRNGAVSFVGFGNIQTDYEIDKNFTKREIAIFNGILVKIIKKSIVYAYQKKYTVEKLTDIIKIMTNKEINCLLTKHKGIKYRHRIACHLYNFKNEIQIFGNKHITLTNFSNN
ncbi:hypothetical protein PFY12_12700 [Chryseobacterium camelliae]|uniref:CHAT domain-containing protein n=1 Tax=Chryseobacterium camelliae TaxID=1265445 RepID=A0ABY7QJS3_9FLAO|nr:hypothetical protein [Chryseobacterium camelliae]WBV59899.1 hypothetical protein PFY12_12700 [Chryseobacterium camelliae]